MNETQLQIRCSRELADQIDHVTKRASEKAGVAVKKSEVVRKALAIGLASLELSYEDRKGRR